MKCVEKLRAKLEVMGASLDDGEFTLICDAPAGYVWRANGCRGLYVQCANGSQTWIAKAAAEAEEEARLGLDKVTEPEAIAMHSEETGEDWKAAPDAPEFIAWPS